MATSNEFQALRTQAGLSHTETALLLRQDEQSIILCDSDDCEAAKIGPNALELLQRFASTRPDSNRTVKYVLRPNATEYSIATPEPVAPRPAAQRYKSPNLTKAHGRTYTSDALAGFVAGQIVQHADVQTGGCYHILDPAIGDGALVIHLLEELNRHSARASQVTAFDTDADALAIASARIGAAFPEVTLDLRHQDFLSFAERVGVGSLFRDRLPSFDLVVANPPYVRTQALQSEAARSLASALKLTGRTDLFHIFVVALSHMVAPRGTVGLIMSNRFMTTRAGAAVRAGLSRELDLRHVWDLGDTKLFDAAVLPAVVIGRKTVAPGGVPAFSTIYETPDAAEATAASPLDALRQTGVVATEDGRRFRVRHGLLEHSASGEDVWRLANTDGNAWLATVRQHSACRFGEAGKVRVGVKTCADKVFIKRDWPDGPDAPELLRPLITHHSAGRFRSKTGHGNWSILYPHRRDDDGRRCTVDLAQYPRSKAYLELHRDQLAARRYVTDAGRKWYEIWVPQDPAAWGTPKLVFRDIVERPTFWIDLGGAVVNGDCYWMTLNEGVDPDILWLAAAVANSTLIEAFYDHCFNNKLYAGRRRFMTQYVEQFPLPDHRTGSAKAIIAKAKLICRGAGTEQALMLEEDVDAAVWATFGLGFKEVPR